MHKIIRLTCLNTWFMQLIADIVILTYVLTLNIPNYMKVIFFAPFILILLHSAIFTYASSKDYLMTKRRLYVPYLMISIVVSFVSIKIEDTLIGYLLMSILFIGYMIHHIKITYQNILFDIPKLKGLFTKDVVFELIKNRGHVFVRSKNKTYHFYLGELFINDTLISNDQLKSFLKEIDIEFLDKMTEDQFRIIEMYSI